MNPETRRTIHLGVNFIVAPAPNLAGGKHLQFQQRLAEEKIEFTQATRNEGQAVFLRQEGPLRLQVQIATPQPQLGQVMAIAAADATSPALEAGISDTIFSREARTIVDVFEEIWPEQNRQIVGCDAALHLLFDSGVAHAFQYLWERRLGQGVESLSELGRPVLGGGLRFVMPATEGPQHPEMVEVKMESFLRDPSKVYIETVMQWPRPNQLATLKPEALIDAIQEYTLDTVVPFVTRGEQ